MKELAIFIDTECTTPIYEQIYRMLRDEIQNGRLSYGEMLPSSRHLADYLQVSRSTVLAAYDQLLAEGYIESSPRKGYRVAHEEEQVMIPKTYQEGYKKKEPVPQEVVFRQQEEEQIDFSPDGISPVHFPYNEWRKNARQTLTDAAVSGDLLNSGDAKGELKLRMLLAGYLRKSRGVAAKPEQIILASGNENLLLILHLLFHKNSQIAVEDPTYLKSTRILQGLGRTVLPIPMDRYGIDVSELQKSPASIVYVTPSHQYPTGVVMSISRRRELLAWAKEDSQRYIIEDDYDSEFRYKGKPIPSLQSIDAEERVIYIGTFSKSIMPAIRMSYMVLPQRLCAIYEETLSFCSNTVSRLDQKMVELFMEQGAFERHLGRMRKRYKSKHDLMVTMLREWKHTRIFGGNAGTHMLVMIKNGMTETELTECAKREGIRVYPLSYYKICSRSLDAPVILIGFAKLEEADIVKGLTRLKQIWRL